MDMRPGDLVRFATRPNRVAYLTDEFASYLQGRALDVGCDRRDLAEVQPNRDHLGIDVRSTPDRVIDLESEERLPFDDHSFDTVVCLEVLDHLDDLHHVLSELVRVSPHRLLISMPNCWTAACRPVTRGKGRIGHYGLPATPPAHRHKWFFGLTEARQFAIAAAERYDGRVREMPVSATPRSAAVRWLRRLRHPQRDRYLNPYAQTLWVVFERPSPGETA